MFESGVRQTDDSMASSRLSLVGMYIYLICVSHLIGGSVAVVLPPASLHHSPIYLSIYQSNNRNTSHHGSGRRKWEQSSPIIIPPADATTQPPTAATAAAEGVPVGAHAAATAAAAAVAAVLVVAAVVVASLFSFIYFARYLFIIRLCGVCQTAL
eukprot:GHVU01221041.1.p1 GENE.GHVU01221041.1~~GHVU01221041.1.p1  ORF type:complete len:155 (-),score=24.19 GHVU01221041.1:115-579(-)